ncbi:MAG: S8 family serine peptidase [Saprospiraceae bacterium]|nr:S8 family serine peptidase [Saprospiraceae bacterium]
MKKQLLFTLLSLIFSVLTAQNSDHKAGQFIVQLKTDAAISALQKTHGFIERSELLSADLNIWCVFFDAKNDEKALLKILKATPSVLEAQVNHILELRQTLPNDALFTQQWHHLNNGSSNSVVDADIDSDDAWDIAKGGVTLDGDTIVVAVIDNGTTLNHPDLVANHWYNRQEIPNNGIDDDQNGFIDDYAGWNASTRNDNVDGGAHGTEVEGVIGASGNNGRGVSGINWAVKIMSIVSDGSEASIVASYAYAYSQRRLYNRTNGKKGAFVVTTNSSFGSSFKFGADAPIWCGMYDSLGSVGILSVGATANTNDDVDQIGDLPSTCGSNYLIIVTATDNKDRKSTDAAFGVVNVDVAAPGDGIWTTLSNGDYGTARGTSLACPIVSGMVGLAYSVPCSDFINLSKTQPANTALFIRDKILKSVDVKANLQGKIATGGRVNSAETLRKIRDFCGTCPQPSRIKTTATTTDATITMNLPAGQSRLTARYRQRGTANWTAIAQTAPPLSINGLLACTDYEVEVSTNCSLQPSVAYSYFFKTDGCCSYPENVVINPILNNSIAVKVSKITAATGYQVCLKESPQAFNCVVNTAFADTAFVVKNLKTCQNYTVFIRANCANNTVSADTVLSLKTKGCSPCIDSNYCRASGSTASEWIDSFGIADFGLISRKGGGYSRFDTIATTLKSGKTYPLGIKPAFNSASFSEGARIWIDYNQDGDFLDVGEQIAEITSFTSTKTTNFTVPNTVVEGITRLRVAMKYVGFSNPLPQPCDNYSGGEVEDYCIKIEKSNGINDIKNYGIQVFPNPFSHYFTITNTYTENKLKRLSLSTIEGKKMWEKQLDGFNAEWTITDLPPLSIGLYFLKIETDKGVFVVKLVK